ncbi:MAG: radical SAM protein [Lachnospiraceae bacterium]|nr:radical SAM protein [Lachnospiraceae bacterium]
MILSYEKCNICPRECNVNRSEGLLGICRTPDGIFAARAALHYWEEPVISGESGSGAIFFTGCNLGCVYCQNREISGSFLEKFRIPPLRLHDIFYELKDQGANNINLVTATHQLPAIIPVLRQIKDEHFPLPIIYNSSGYEKADALRELEGLIDIYLPDFKYVNNETAKRYSKAPDYPEVALSAIKEMARQTGAARFTDENKYPLTNTAIENRPTADSAKDGIDDNYTESDGNISTDDYTGSPLIKKGTIVRHLVLPGHYEESKEAVKLLYDTFGDDIYISIMSQYTPMPEMVNNRDFPELGESINRKKYDEIVDYAIDLGVENGFIQEEEADRLSFIPCFDGTGIIR